MRFIITGRNIDITEGLKAAVEEKLGKLDRFFAPETEVNVTLSVEKERQKIEVTIPVKGNIIRSEQVSNDMYVSVDLAAEVIERQFKKYKGKIASKKVKMVVMPEIEDLLEEDEQQIVRRKEVFLKPIDEEEAITQMELLGHTFFVFKNVDTDKINVVYKRNDVF